MPAATSSRRAAALPPRERRAAIIDATRPLLVEYGETVTTRQIADAAGIGEGTIFRVFTDKDELLLATLESALDPAPLERAFGDIDVDAPFEAQLVEAATIVQRWIADIWGLVSNLGPRLREQARRPSGHSEALAVLFERSAHRLRVDPATASQLLRALTLSVTHPMLADEPMTPEDIVALLLRGIEVGR